MWIGFIFEDREEAMDFLYHIVKRVSLLEARRWTRQLEWVVWVHYPEVKKWERDKHIMREDLEYAELYPSYKKFVKAIKIMIPNENIERVKIFP